MPIDPNWIRWIHASVGQHFKDFADNNTIKFLVEGDERDPIVNVSDYVEFRMEGPHIEEISKDYYSLKIQVNILVISRDDDKLLYKVYDTTGKMLTAFTNAIPVFKYGTGPDDDQSILECFVLCKQQGDNLVVTDMGRLVPDLEERQNSITGYYCMYLVTN